MFEGGRVKIGKEHIGKKVRTRSWSEERWLEVLDVNTDSDLMWARDEDGDSGAWRIDIKDWQLVEEECEEGYDISELRKKFIEQLDKAAREMGRLDMSETAREVFETLEKSDEEG